MPGLSGSPWMVCVFPELEAPYVKTSWFWPSRNSLTRGSTIESKRSLWAVWGGKILVKAYLEERRRVR